MNFSNEYPDMVNFHAIYTFVLSAIFCSSNPCQNGGTCDPSVNKCLCQMGTDGAFCERGIS